MRVVTLLGITGLALFAACQDPMAPEQPVADEVDAPVAVALSPDNKCYGQVVAGISSTWPWAHDNKAGFDPPKGAVAKWLEEFGPGLGISTVRELQILACE